MQIKRIMQRTAVRRAALRYARRFWPVMPGAYLVQGRYLCGPLCPTVACHPALEGWEKAASCDSDDIASWWSDDPFSVLLVTGRAFDAIEVSGRLGRLAFQSAPRMAPVIISPAGRWTFLVAPGNGLRPELDAQLDVVLHGRGSWIQAPPTRTPLGRVTWMVAPEEAGLPSSYSVQAELVRHLPEQGAAPTFATSLVTAA